ncbi:amidohydrolase family protein [Sandaracinobacteroides saxicola]|uniref:Amidohydrolase family protein n=1 Tax=Sandaracinobacteroides saxicola TaxID=2759707 RepID=A0A7G5II79_9SPHN|nr:amidohydrolase family protein [Sandaracinobacteroides saxicola]QMW23071.1 amidohydrolase family protein [Sandaracinobacteroides saxicola]
MIVDGHHHFWHLNEVHYPWLAAAGTPRFFGDPDPIRRDYGVPEFRADHAHVDVRASVHIQVGAADAFAETAWVARHAAAQGWPVGIVAAADLTAATLADDLARHAALADGRLRGVRQIVARHPSEDGPGAGALLRDPAFARGLETLAAAGLRFDLQLTGELLAEAAAVFGAVPALRVALCHAGSPWDASEGGMARWREGLHAFAALPGAVVKLSGLGMLRRDGAGVGAIADGLLAAFGTARMIWGSNCPVDALHRPWQALYAEARALVPAAGREAVFGGNAAAFYDLDTKTP